MGIKTNWEKCLEKHSPVAHAWNSWMLLKLDMHIAVFTILLHVWIHTWSPSPSSLDNSSHWDSDSEFAYKQNQPPPPTKKKKEINFSTKEPCFVFYSAVDTM